MSQRNEYRIEFLTEIPDLRQCVELQKLTWGFADEDVLPLRSLVVCGKIGGQVLGAITEERRVLGFINAFPGFRNGQVYLHSQMMAVRPEVQNQGIGKSLKLAQREEALQRGISRVEWTFDPLEIRNARFNIELLGALCRRYFVNSYGVTTSHLHGGLPTDRLVAEWYLNSPRVCSQLGLLASEAHELVPKGAVDIPTNIGEIKMNDPHSALKIQLSLRHQMQEFFRQGLCLTRFRIDRNAGKATYLFESADNLLSLS